MMIKKIVLTNVFVYEGKNEFEFDNTQKNISLIIGENGFGKTSFINALKIGFHGLTKDILRVGGKYISKSEFIRGNEYFEGLITKNKDFAEIEIYTDEFTIIRSFKEDEKLLLIRDTEEFFDLEAEDIIDEFFPRSLNKFFFFDGERIQEIANFENEEFKKMLESVLKLDVYDKSIEDLNILKKKYLKDYLDKNTLQKLNSLERTYEDVSKQIEKLENEYNTLKTLLKEKQKEEKFFIQKSASTKKLQQQLLEKKEEFDRKILEFKQLILYKLPLILNSSLLEKMKKDIKNYDDLGVDKEILLKKKREFLEKIGANREIEKVFDEVFLKEKKGFIKAAKVLPLLEFEQIDLKAFLETLSNLKFEVEELEKSLKTSSDLFSEINSIQKEIMEIESRIKKIEEDIFSLKEELFQIEKEIKALSKIEFKNRLVKEKINTVENSILALQKIKLSLKAKKRPKLEKIINEKFKALKKESFKIQKINLTDEFDIYLIDENSQKLSILSASSGQKQIIATALIWGISEYLNKEIPMVIDTPLGRLDIENQRLILKEFYPNASKQVIMLPTPSELRAEEFSILDNFIADKYCLTSQTPKVRKCAPQSL